MKKINFSVIILGVVILAIFCAIGKYIYNIDRVRQEVNIVSESHKAELWLAWEKYKADELPTLDTIKEENPYSTDETLYELVTIVNRKREIDYGTEKEIAKLKCKRYTEFVNSIKSDEFYREKIEEAENRRDRKAHEALKRLNDIDCKN